MFNCQQPPLATLDNDHLLAKIYCLKTSMKSLSSISLTTWPGREKTLNSSTNNVGKDPNKINQPSQGLVMTKDHNVFSNLNIEI